MLRVGVTSRHHGTGPSFRLAEVPNVEYVDEYLYPMGTRFTKHLPLLRNVSRSIGLARVRQYPNLLHSYQKILLNAIPWIVSYDGLMPFYPRPYGSKRLFDAIFSLLARDECRAVLPHSENALRQMLIRNQDSRYLDAVMERTQVVYPSVRDYDFLAEKCLSRDPLSTVRLLFVGTQFFLKGGQLAVGAFSKLRRRYPLSMVVVSSLSTEDWTTYRPPSLAVEWKNRLAGLGITYHPYLDNRKVRQLMSESDILLLPSIDETFGFVLLEAMATGMAVIATNIGAIPEIVENGSTGILVACKRDEEGRLVRDGRHEQEIEEQVAAALQQILDDRVRLQKMKLAGRRRYLDRFSMVRLGQDLQKIYLRALQA